MPEKQYPLRVNKVYFWLYEVSRIPVPIHVYEAEVESDLSPYFIEAPMGLMVVFDYLSMSSIAEGSVGWVLAVAQFVVPALVHVEWHGTAPSYSCVAGSIAIWVTQTKPTGAPGVDLALLEIGVVWEKTCMQRSLPELKGMLGGRYLPSL